jgi:DNA repair exonuclease SbcCD ATPase subunit
LRDLRRADGSSLSIQRFTQELLNNELAEVSNKTLSTDLQELRVAFNRLSTEHARAVGWEVRLREALQERDDFHQERDSEAQKLRGAEAKLTSLSDKCGEPRPRLITFFCFIFYEAKLDLEVRVLEEQLEEEREKRGQATEEMMHEARQWLAGLQHSVGL